MAEKKSALFICLGNICRSPIAAAVFKFVVEDLDVADKWTCESAALGSWHVGNPMDPRSETVLQKHHLDSSHRARQLKKEDFTKFDFIFGMDKDNMQALKSKAPANSTAKLLLLGTFDPEGDIIIEDPYYDKEDSRFEKCYQQCLRSCTGFVKQYKQGKLESQ